MAMLRGSFEGTLASLLECLDIVLDADDIEEMRLRVKGVKMHVEGKIKELQPVKKLKKSKKVNDGIAMPMY